MLASMKRRDVGSAPSTEQPEFGGGGTRVCSKYAREPAGGRDGSVTSQLVLQHAPHDQRIRFADDPLVGVESMYRDQSGLVLKV